MIAEQLLTAKDVAKYLQISERTVYDRKRELQGYYPFGIGRLRFRPEVIYGDLEGQGKGALEIPVRVPGGDNDRTRLCYAPRGRDRKRKAPKGNQGPIKTDPARHGL